jgi:hypothetical protein
MPSLGIGSCGGGVSCALANPDKKKGKMNGATAEARREKTRYNRKLFLLEIF